MDWKDVLRAAGGLLLVLAWFVGGLIGLLLQDMGIFARGSNWVVLPMAVCVAGVLLFLLWPRISEWLWEWLMASARKYRCLRHFVAKYITKEDLPNEK